MPEEETVPAGPERPARASILVVDDNPANIDLLVGLLRGRGARVLVATSGRGALRVVQAERPDLVLLDVNMPAPDGYEVCRRLKADPATAEVPVIFLSALDDAIDKVRAFSAGGADYVTKPFHLEEVAARVEAQLGLASARRALAAQNEELSRLGELKNRFVGVAAHDLRSPLSIVQMYAEYLSHTAADRLSAEEQELLEGIVLSARRMIALVSDLLDVSRIESGQLVLERRAAPLLPLVEEAVATHALLAARKDVRVELVPGPEPGPLSLDPLRVTQVLDNLLGNAVKFSRPGQRVRVEVARLPAGEASVRVADQGPGIPVEEQGGLFTFYGRTSVRPTAGEPSSGLGLAIARRIVEAHGGRLWVESAPGAGSTFAFALPA